MLRGLPMHALRNLPLFIRCLPACVGIPTCRSRPVNRSFGLCNERLYHHQGLSSSPASAPRNWGFFDSARSMHVGAPAPARPLFRPLRSFARKAAMHRQLVLNFTINLRAPSSVGGPWGATGTIKRDEPPTPTCSSTGQSMVARSLIFGHRSIPVHTSFVHTMQQQVSKAPRPIKRGVRKQQQPADRLLGWVLQLSLASLYTPISSVLLKPLGRVVAFQLVCARKWAVLVSWVVQLISKAVGWTFQPAFARETRIQRILRAYGLAGAKRVHVALGECGRAVPPAVPPRGEVPAAPQSPNRRRGAQLDRIRSCSGRCTGLQTTFWPASFLAAARLQCSAAAASRVALFGSRAIVSNKAVLRVP